MRTSAKPRTPIRPCAAMTVSDNTGGRPLDARKAAREISFLFGRELLTRLAAQREAASEGQS